jgi:hypothetical protein
MVNRVSSASPESTTIRMKPRIGRKIIRVPDLRTLTVNDCSYVGRPLRGAPAV